MKLSGWRRRRGTMPLLPVRWSKVSGRSPYLRWKSNTTMTTSSFDNALPWADHSVPISSGPDAAIAGAVWRTVKAALPSLNNLQGAASGIYGRLETDRALVWTVEELGELAQAIRREEGQPRLEEELGQLTAWMFCLANILNVDLAAAVELAMRKEIERQLAKYGKLTPYSSHWRGR
jgi:NTP pyrophosphatase (non-canonical NTP hydrolase)